MEWLKGWLSTLLNKLLDQLVGWLNDLLEWFFNLCEWLPKKVYAVVMDGLASFLEAIPVPSFITDAAGAFGGIPTTVMYFASVFELNFGVTVVLLALVARFALRRIPFIG